MKPWLARLRFVEREWREEEKIFIYKYTYIGKIELGEGRREEGERKQGWGCFSFRARVEITKRCVELAHSACECARVCEMMY